MKISYKFWYIIRDDNIHISECAIRFYEGDITTEDERDENDDLVSITRYRVSKRLQAEDLEYLKKTIKKEKNGYDCVPIILFKFLISP